MSAQTPLDSVTRAAGAVFVEEGSWLVPAHFGDPVGEYAEARTGAVLFDRCGVGTLEAFGPEAIVFLHNLSTNDLRNLPTGVGCEAFLCNHTARVLDHLFIFRDPLAGKAEQLWLDLPTGDPARVLAHLERHLISEDVVLSDRTPTFARVHLAGPDAAGILAHVLGESADLEPMRQKIVGRQHLRRTDLLALPGFDLIVPREEGPALWEALVQAGARPAGREAFEVLRVEGGFPLYGIDITEQTFAPEVGRTHQAISYNKGCYLGQEPIVMARDRGQVNRVLLGLKLTGPDPAPAGCFLYREKEVGRVTSSVFSPRLGTAIALAYVRRGNQQPGTAVEVEVAGHAGRAR